MTQTTNERTATQEQSAILSAARKLLVELSYADPTVACPEECAEIRDRLEAAADRIVAGTDTESDPHIEDVIHEAKCVLGLICPACGEESEFPVDEHCSRECYRRNGIDDGGAL